MSDLLLEMLNKWVGLFGGASAIITALLYFLQRMHFSRFENDLQKTREKLNRILESEVHAKKKIFDKEFTAYEELWELITDLEKETHKLLSLFESHQQIDTNAQSVAEAKLQYITHYNSTTYKIRKLSPFIPADFYEDVGKRLGAFRWTTQSVEVNGSEREHLKILDTNIAAIRNGIENMIRVYVKNL